MKDKKVIRLVVAILLILTAAFASISLMNRDNTPEVPFSIPDNHPDSPIKSPSGYSLKCSRTYEPVCGTIQIEKCEDDSDPCEKPITATLQKTFPNNCSAKEDNALILFKGTCEAQRSYSSNDPQKCAVMDIGCQTGTTYFEDKTGCGCQTNQEAHKETATKTANREYISQDEDVCKIKNFSCEEGETIFQDEQGCGCEATIKSSLWETDQVVTDENSTDLPETLLFEGCPEILYELLCPEDYYKFEQGENCGCMKQQ